MSDSVKNFHKFTFSRKHFRFHPQKVLMTFFSHRLKILNFLPIFPLSVHFPPVSRKLLFPLLLKISRCFVKCTCFFLHTLCVFCLPPNLTMMHLCMTQCTYWTPLCLSIVYLIQIASKHPFHIICLI